MQSDRSMRETDAGRILGFLIIGTALVFAIIISDGLDLLDLDKDIVVTLSGSTAIAAIGLVGFVTKGLFK